MPSSALTATAKDTTDVKITRLVTYRVPPRWLFLKVETDAGIDGWGEPVLEGHARAAEAAVQELAGILVGTDPRRINDMWQLLYRHGCYRGGPVLMSAISGIDTALWDILGKSLGSPVHQLLGGAVRDKVRTYSWIGGDEPTELVAAALAARAAGFSAVKFNASGPTPMAAGVADVDGIVQRIGELRDAVGPTMDLAVDFHGRIHRLVAQVLLRELEPLRLLWVEDPLAADNEDATIELARGTSVPIAVGERVHSRSTFMRLMASQAISVINPDPAHVGGITATVRLGAAAEMYDVMLAPHCPLGPIALAACLQIDAVCHNAAIQEQSLGIHYNVGSDLLDYVTPGSFDYRDGFVTIPGGPGLGVTVDEDAVRDRAATTDWQAPVWRHPDGSIAEW